MFRKFRILLLLVVLATVGLASWRASSRLTSWQHTVHVALYPVAADDSPDTQRYVASLNQESFEEIGEWVAAEVRRYGKTVLQPVVIRVAPPLREQPPAIPVRGGALDNILWSLKLRWWASQNDAIAGPKPMVRLYVLYHDPERTPSAPHSTGLENGQIGIIHAYASRRQHRQNAIVIAHEMLHTFGASDKYNLSTLQPIAPDGLADPERTPLYPQRQAEIMAGRVALAADRAETPPRLVDTLIGPATAREIGLLN